MYKRLYLLRAVRLEFESCPGEGLVAIKVPAILKGVREKCPLVAFTILLV